MLENTYQSTNDSTRSEVVPQDEVINLIDFSLLGFFTVAVVIAVIKLLFRIRQYWKSEWDVPRLLWRDLVLFVGLAVPFFLILVARALGFSELVKDELSWHIMTGTPAVVGVWFWLYFEFFKIDEADEKDYRLPEQPSNLARPRPREGEDN